MNATLSMTGGCKEKSKDVSKQAGAKENAEPTGDKGDGEKSAHQEGGTDREKNQTTAVSREGGECPNTDTHREEGSSSPCETLEEDEQGYPDCPFVLGYVVYNGEACCHGYRFETEDNGWDGVRCHFDSEGQCSDPETWDEFRGYNSDA